jgi:site-specific recombinase XerD
VIDQHLGQLAKRFQPLPSELIDPGLQIPDHGSFVSVVPQASAFLEHCQSEGLQFSTYRKYRNSLNHLEAFCVKRGIDAVRELSMDDLDAFRAGRGLKPVTASKELQLLRQFCAFCLDRRWAAENAAKRIKPPRNIKPNDVEPFSLGEVGKVIESCGDIGRTSYERLRARAMVLALRYTALRIGDVAMLARDRISRDGNRWRTFLRTEKSGKPVFLPIPTELRAAFEALPLPRNCGEETKWFF